MSNHGVKRVLFAVLDWGLGHATRSSVLIDELIRQNTEVMLASSGRAQAFLRRKYPNLMILSLPNKPVVYGAKSAHWQLAKRAFLQSAINAEQQRWIATQVEQFGISHIISDNVYGAYHAKIPSVLISHQLKLPMPFGGVLLNRVLGTWLAKFDKIWIPDVSGENSLAGDLIGKWGSAQDLKVKVEYLGILSRFNQPIESEKTIDILAFSSGVEQQISVFEKILAEALQAIPGSLILAGYGQFLESYQPRKGLQVMLEPDDALMNGMAEARFVICRSGYSSLSDLLAAGCRALVVPTPGQYEQEYLARRVSEKGWFHTLDQKELKAEKIAEVLSGYFVPPQLAAAYYPSIIRNFLAS